MGTEMGWDDEIRCIYLPFPIILNGYKILDEGEKGLSSVGVVIIVTMN